LNETENNVPITVITDVKTSEKIGPKAKLANILTSLQNIPKTHPSLWAWGILATILVFMFYSHLYWDIVITTRHGINLWHVLFEGKLLDFYLYNDNPPITGGFNSSYAIYPFPVYIIFAVWNLPLFLLEKLANFDVFESKVALLYAKSILLPFLVGSAYLVRKICLQLKVSKANSAWSAFFFMSSTLVLFSLVVVGQYDIFSVTFSLIGVYFYLKQDFKKFIVFFAIAIPLKMFALFIFIPLLLLYEKRLLRIAINCGLVMSVYAVCSALFVLPQAAAGISHNMISYLFRNTLPLTWLNTPIFVIMTVLLWCWCYAQKRSEACGFKAIFAAFLSMAVLFVTSYTHLYWIILMSPFIIILLFRKQENQKLVYLLEMFACGAVIFTLNITSSPAWGMQTINKGFLSSLFGNFDGKYTHLGTIMVKFMSNDLALTLAHCCTAVFVAGMVAFAVLQFKSFANTKVETAETSVEEQPPFEIIWGRVVLNVVVCGTQIGLFLMQKLAGIG
jgi:hypothetical protein